jgi:hypothetical protein
MRIVVIPERLQQLGSQMQQVGSQLRALDGRLGSATAGLSWEARSRANIDGSASQARSRARNLAEQAENLGRFLGARAQAFNDADRQGVNGMAQVAVGYAAMQRDWLEGPGAVHSFPLEEARTIAGLGQYLQPLLSGVAIAASIRPWIGNRVIIDLPDVIRDFGISLRSVREWAGLSGHLNTISYANIPSHFLKWGLITAVPAVASKWFTDVRQYTGTQLASALTVDAGLTLLPVGVSFLTSKGGMALGAAIGTAICPGVGTVIGGAAGAIIGGVAGSVATQWAIEHYAVREKAIDWVDTRVMMPTAQMISQTFPVRPAVAVA